MVLDGRLGLFDEDEPLSLSYSFDLEAGWPAYVDQPCEVEPDASVSVPISEVVAPPSVEILHSDLTSDL